VISAEWKCSCAGTGHDERQYQLPELVRRLGLTHGKMSTAFGKDPVETLREHVWVAPFQEDRITPSSMRSGWTT
jgi:hypothetical protein